MLSRDLAIGCQRFEIGADLIENAFQIGGAVHLIIMTIGLGSRIERAERERRQAEQSALVAAQSAERHASQIAEARTRELQLAKGKLEQSLAAERRLSNEQLQFIHMISHEYRTPVAVLRTNLDLLRMAESKGAPVPAPPLKRMADAIFRLIEVIEISLKGERVVGDQMAAEKTAVYPDVIIEDAIQIARNAHPGRTIEYSAAPASDELVIFADAALLKTALVNLIDNALKYSPKDAPVGIALAPLDDTTLSICVSDSGAGIGGKDLPFIFEKYYRADNVAGSPGAGIGLHLVKSIVNAHGGDVSLTSSPAGTMFRIALPLLAREKGALAADA